MNQLIVKLSILCYEINPKLQPYCSYCCPAQVVTDVLIQLRY